MGEIRKVKSIEKEIASTNSTETITFAKNGT